MQKTASSLESDNDDDDDNDNDNENNNNNNSNYNLLSACYVSAALLSTLHLLSQLILHQSCEVCIRIISIL